MFMKIWEDIQDPERVELNLGKKRNFNSERKKMKARENGVKKDIEVLSLQLQ